ncbi:histidine kinase [Actinomycetota bacterium]
MNIIGAPRAYPSRWAAGVLVVTVLGAMAIAWLELAGRNGGSGSVVGDSLTTLVTVISFGVAGAVLIDRRSDLLFGWLLAGAAVTQVILAWAVLSAAAALEAGSESSLVGWGLAAGSLGFIPVAVHGLVLVRFPSGTPISRSARVLEFGIIVGTVLVVVGGLFGATSLRDVALPLAAELQHPLTGGTTIGKIGDALLLVAPVVVLLGLVAGVGVVARFLRADGIERQQLKWMATWVIVSLALFPFAVGGLTDVIDPFVSLLFVVMLAVPVLRYRLWAIDTIIRRSAVYGLVTVSLVCVYVALTALGAGLFSERVGASVAAVAVALGFVPLRNRVQRFVDRVAYGSRNDPYRAISDLDRRLSEIAAPGQVLPALVETIASSLRLPFVAIERIDGSPLATHGRPGATTERWPLVYEGVVEGELVASPRRGEEEFDQRDRQLLADLARHTGAAVHAEALTADLLASRQRLVTTREEERRRLRRDLHDGLGPVLTAIGLNLDAARSQLRTAPEAAGHYLDDAKAAATQAIDDIRRLVYGLRPPALDNLGLIGAIRLHTDRLRTERTRVDVFAEELPTLPAAVEVAAYRTAIEAVTNAIRHGGAKICTVSLHTAPGEFVVDIQDDGSSTGPWVPGVGLTSIREQSDELGGSVKAGPIDSVGARLTARFPLPEAQP